MTQVVISIKDEGEKVAFSLHTSQDDPKVIEQIIGGYLVEKLDEVLEEFPVGFFEELARQITN